MNPCTLMGGFWFWAGKALFGFTVFMSIALLILIALLISVWTEDRKLKKAREAAKAKREAEQK